MALEAELAEGGVEEVTPLAVVAFIHINDDMDMVADGDALDLGGRGGGDRKTIRGGGIRVGGRRSHWSGREDVA